MKSQLPNERITFTGHSLGGGLASTASLATGDPAIIFNAAGTHPFTRIRAGGFFHGSDVTSYSIDGDILTGAQLLTPLPNAYGNVIQLKPADQDAGSFALTLHKMDVVLRALNIFE